MATASVAQCFEFLCTLDKNGSDIAPGLAESWSPNDDGTVWTFKLRQRRQVAGRQGLHRRRRRRHDGPPGRSRQLGPEGRHRREVGGRDRREHRRPSRSSARTATSRTSSRCSTLSRCITPKDYATGTTLDAMPNGTGAWKLDTYDHATGATFSRNDAWWGGKTPLDTLEFVFFDETGPMVTAYQGGQVDCIVQFDVLSGEALLTDANSTSSRPAPRCIARSGCGSTRASSRRSESARRWPTRSIARR